MLLVYKELFEEGITDKNLLEKHIELWKEVKSWRENGTPF